MKKAILPAALCLLLAGLASSAPSLLINKIVVQVGPDGTDDDVTMKICDTSKCCTTKKLSHTLSSEWVKDKVETWDGSKLGNCSQILFDSGASKLDVTVNKATKKKDSLDITSVTLEGASASNKKDIKKSVKDILIGALLYFTVQVPMWQLQVKRHRLPEDQHLPRHRF